MPGEAQDENDPLEVFRAVARTSDDAAATAQDVLTALEVHAVKTAQPTPGSADLIITAEQTGRTVTIVSNNSGAAISTYLADHQLTGYIKAIVARDDHDQDRMKPSPYRVREALRMLGGGKWGNAPSSEILPAMYRPGTWQASRSSATPTSPARPKPSPASRPRQ